MSPPIAGPRARAALNCVELRVIAFLRYPWGTHSATKACPTGIMNPDTMPFRKKRPTQPPGLRSPAAHATAIPAAVSAATPFTARRSRRRSRLSEIQPATGLTRSMGTKFAKPAIPTQAAEPVNW